MKITIEVARTRDGIAVYIANTTDTEGRVLSHLLAEPKSSVEDVIQLITDTITSPIKKEIQS